MDLLGSQSIRSTNAHTNIGLCNPSRNSLFTGIYPHQSRNFGLEKNTNQALFKNNKTLMERFSENEVQGEHPGWAYSDHDDKIFHFTYENDRDLLPDEMHAQWAAQRLNEMDIEGTNQPFFMAIGLFVRIHHCMLLNGFFDMLPIEDIELPVIEDGDITDSYYNDNYPVERTKDDKWYTNTSKGRMYSKLLEDS